MIFDLPQPLNISHNATPQVDALFKCGRYGRAISNLSVSVYGGNHVSKLIAFLKDDSGATAIEYGLIAAGISVAIIGIVNTLGSQLTTKFTSVSTQLK